MSIEVSSNSPGEPGEPGAALNPPAGAATETKHAAPTGTLPVYKMSRESVTVIVTLLVATFVVILNETIMNVALQRLMVDLRVDAPTVQWLSTGFMLTMAVVIPTTGFILQRLSTRAVFLLAMGLFSGGTATGGAAPGFEVLLLARIVQAGGTAIMLPLLMTTILTLVPLARRGAVMGNVSIAISVAPAMGPTVSGLILEHFSWRFMFVFVLPIALAALGDRCQVPDQRRRNGKVQARLPVRGADHPRVRRPGLRPQPDRRRPRRRRRTGHARPGSPGHGSRRTWWRSCSASSSCRSPRPRCWT